jgi:hypothetical protein
MAKSLRVLVLAGRIGGVGMLAIASYFAIRQGISGWYFEKGQPQDLEVAKKWDPGNPQFPDALGHVMQLYSENPDPAPVVRLYERAVRLSPNNAHYWADLGAAYDSAGRTRDALHAFEQARTLFPNSPEINWSLANFYVRTGRLKESVGLLRSILESGGVDETQVFSLATHATGDADAVIAQVLPARPPFLEHYFDYLVAAGNLNQAAVAWKQLVESKQPFDLARSISYVNARIEKQDIDGASEVWEQLIARFPAQMNPRLGLGNLVTNGDFTAAILNGGFDWRVFPIPGATVSVEPANPDGGSLEIVFDGSRNLDYGHVLQFVRVEPKTRYHFSGEIRTQGITTDSGARFQIFDLKDMAHLFLSTDNRIGTSAWWTEKLNFETGSNTRLLVLRVARPASAKLDNKVEGSVWVRHILVVAEP